MRVLVIGSGAREHALCVALTSDPAVEALACAPGNAGTRALAEPSALDVRDPDAIAALEQVRWHDRETVRAVYAATLVKRQPQRITFDAVFDIYYPRLVGRR